MSAETIQLKQANDLERPSRAMAEEAVRTLLAYYGENPAREGLVDTPRRFVDAYEEFLAGYDEDPVAILSRTFEEVEGYQDIVLMRDIRFESHCEHHIQPMIGTAHVAYLPGSSRCRHFKTCARRRCFRPAPAKPGNADEPDRQRHRDGAAASRRRGAARSRTPVHFNSRHS